MTTWALRNFAGAIGSVLAFYAMAGLAVYIILRMLGLIVWTPNSAFAVGVAVGCALSFLAVLVIQGSRLLKADAERTAQ